MAFRTKLDFSSNRQVKQHIETFTVLSGGTSFGVPFSSLPMGPDLATTGTTFTIPYVLSTFSGNSANTVYTWYDSFMEIGVGTLSALTPSISGITQYGIGFSGTSFTTIDGNTVTLAYTGITFDLIPVAMYDLGSGNYSGSVQTDLLEYLSASTLNFTGRTIWADVSGITRTQDLIITNNPVIGNVWTCIDSEGKGNWIPSASSSGGTSFTGGTVTGPTDFTNGLSANSISATTYLNLPNYGTSPITIVNTSNLFSTGLAGTGINASGGTFSIFLGPNAGYEATNVTNSNFIGQNAGFGATNASFSNFFGPNAGFGATNASYSNFFGGNAGFGATGASQSNFFGYEAGIDASGASDSNFWGHQAGSFATNARNSNFIGQRAGRLATNASYSTFIGYEVGYGVGSNNNIGSNNIIIGTNISLPNGTANSINLGGVLFGTGTYSTTSGNPSISGQTTGRIGVNVVTPSESLDVDGNARIRTIGSSASSGALYYTSTGVLTTNTSDNRLKHNIQTLTNALDKVKQLRGVSYDWIEGNGPTRIGFIAQEVESVVPELTFINNNSPEKYMGVHYENTVALLVEAIKELTSGTTLVGNLQTQTILAEDNNIDLNHNGTQTTALGGGITVLHAMGLDLGAELITDENGNWITNNDFIPNKITIPNYTPSGSTDINGNLGNVTRDEDYLYIKTTSGWKRTNLESF